MQNAEVVGVARQGMHQAEYRLLLRGEDRTRVYSLGSGPEHSAVLPEHRAERALGDARDFSDQLQLILIQPKPHVGIQLGQHFQRLRRQELPFIAGRYV